MEIIAVTGKAKGVGKTTLAGLIVCNLRYNVGAIKCSLEEGQEDRLVTDHPLITGEKGTDTAHFLSCGALKAVFLRTSCQRLKEDLHRAIDLCAGVDYLVIEGNSILKFLNPSLVIYVERGDVKAKPSAGAARQRADLIVDYFGISRLKTERLRYHELPFMFNLKEISCRKAWLLASALGISLPVLGKKLDLEGIKVRKCSLGLF